MFDGKSFHLALYLVERKKLAFFFFFFFQAVLICENSINQHLTCLSWCCQRNAVVVYQLMGKQMVLGMCNVTVGGS